MKTYDVIVIGGGVTGAATLYAIANYTPLKNLLLIEKNAELGQVASKSTTNSQTLHFGDIETNYSKEKAAKVKEQAEFVQAYVEKHAKESLHSRSHKMVLAVGEKEVRELTQRYEKFKDLFPGLEKLDRDQIAKLEPKVVEGRSEEILALKSEDGYIIDYGRLAQSLATHSGASVNRGEEVERIEREGGGFRITTGKRMYAARTIVVAAGGYSLLFAHEMDYGKDWILLPTAGSFYCGRNLLNGKCYTMQIEKLPFAAVHGDPDVHDPGETRFGPTAKVLPMMERYDYSTVWAFLRLFRFRIDAILALLKISSDLVITRFLLKNVLYDLPLIGKWAFLSNVRKIVPSVKPQDIWYGKGLGGIRPQIVDVKKREMVMGEAKIVEDGIIFDITPSPGASVCLGNAEKNAKTIARFLGVRFDEGRFRKDHAPQ